MAVRGGASGGEPGASACWGPGDHTPGSEFSVSFLPSLWGSCLSPEGCECHRAGVSVLGAVGVRAQGPGVGSSRGLMYKRTVCGRWPSRAASESRPGPPSQVCGSCVLPVASHGRPLSVPVSRSRPLPPITWSRPSSRLLRTHPVSRQPGAQVPGSGPQHGSASEGPMLPGASLGSGTAASRQHWAFCFLGPRSCPSPAARPTGHRPEPSSKAECKRSSDYGLPPSCPRLALSRMLGSEAASQPNRCLRATGRPVYSVFPGPPRSMPRGCQVVALPQPQTPHPVPLPLGRPRQPPPRSGVCA